MRHEKLGWEEIFLQAAKIVSFIGMLVVGRKCIVLINHLQTWPGTSDI